MHYVLSILLLMLAHAMGSGCDKSAPYSNGKGGESTFQHSSGSRKYYMHIPSGYNSKMPSKVVFLFHGWGYSGLEWGEGKGWGAVSATSACNTHNYILISPTGMSDSSLSGNCDNGAGYCSWHGVGTADSPGPAGTTCNLNNQKTDYCYKDTCGSCNDKCWWSHCNDDVQFVVDLLDHISELVCVDPSNVFAGGESNGGAFTWELSQKTLSAERFAALSPTIGLPHRGFLSAPKVLPMPILVTLGSSDTTMPPGSNNADYSESGDGWYYITGRAATKIIAGAHGCSTSGNPTSYSTGSDGKNGLACTSYQSGCSVSSPVVDCRQNGGHVVRSHIPDLMLEFFNKHPRCAGGSEKECYDRCPIESGEGCNCDSYCSGEKMFAMREFVSGESAAPIEFPAGAIIAIVAAVMLVAVGLAFVVRRQLNKKQSNNEHTRLIGTKSVTAAV